MSDQQMKPATSDLPRPIPCKCGAAPAVTNTLHSRISILRIECRCGIRGAALLYSKVEDEAFMRQAAIDGWNLRL